jgi:hypothetical protein
MRNAEGNSIGYRAKGKRHKAKGIGQNYEMGNWNTDRIAECKARVD